jgi:hypothetical protein
MSVEDSIENQALYDDFRRQLKSSLEERLFDHWIAGMAGEYIETEDWNRILTSAFEGVTR